MYTFVSSLIRAKGTNQPYRNVNISRVKLAQIFKTYSDGYVELSNPSLGRHTFVSLDDLKSAQNLVYTDLPFNDWLSVQGNTTIFATVETKPTIKSGTVSFSDAIQAGFSLRRVNPSDVAGNNLYTSDQLRDIYATKNIGDPALLHKKVLTSVNGLFHINIPHGNGLLIKGGGTSFNLEQDNLVGVLSFETVADIEQVVMRKEMFNVSTTMTPYRKAIYINLRKDLRNKSIILSLAGRLFIADDLIDVVNWDGVIRINTHKLDLFRIIQESIGKIDTKTLELDEKIYHMSALTPENCTDDTAVIALFELLQSFLVLVDTPLILTEKIALMYPNSPGYYESYANAKLPYIDDYGVMHPYWKMIHSQKYQNVNRFHLKNTVYTNPVHESTGYRDPSYRYSKQYQYRGHRQFSIGHLIKITNQEIVTE